MTLQKANHPALSGHGGPDADLRSFHEGWPGYRPTPHIALDDLAGQVGVASILVKDEGHRMGLDSFKILGSSWALHQRTRRLAGEDQHGLTFEQMRDVLKERGPRGLCTASDGNHGHAVAVLAMKLGLTCEVHLPAGTDARRVSQIERTGAEVHLVSGSYSEAVKAARENDCLEGLLHCPDTALPDDSPDDARFASDVIDGYGTLWQELADDVAAPPDVVFIQAGVGAFAASGVRALGLKFPGVLMVAVEPVGSACVTASLDAGHPVAVSDTSTSMDGLRCQLVSMAAWPTLENGLAGTVVVDDETALEASEILSASGILSGPSGAAGLAGLLVAARDQRARGRPRLDAGTSVIVVNTEDQSFLSAGVRTTC
jgi:diaminopropionate ammonia-lyase